MGCCRQIKTLRLFEAMSWDFGLRRAARLAFDHRVLRRSRTALPGASKVPAGQVPLASLQERRTTWFAFN